jgi:hypothetical protein
MKIIGEHVRIQKVKGFPGFAWYSLGVVFALGLPVKLRGMTGDLYAWKRDSSVAEDILA